MKTIMENKNIVIILVTKQHHVKILNIGFILFYHNRIKTFSDEPSLG